MCILTGINEVLGDLEGILGPDVHVCVGGDRFDEWIFGHEVVSNFTIGGPVGIREWLLTKKMVRIQFIFEVIRNKIYLVFNRR